MSDQILEVPPLGVAAVLRLERAARSMVKRLGHATNEYPPPPRRCPAQISIPATTMTGTTPSAWTLKYEHQTEVRFDQSDMM